MISKTIWKTQSMNILKVERPDILPYLILNVLWIWWEGPNLQFWILDTADHLRLQTSLLRHC